MDVAGYRAVSRLKKNVKSIGQHHVGATVRMHRERSNRTRIRMELRVLPNLPFGVICAVLSVCHARTPNKESFPRIYQSIGRWPEWSARGVPLLFVDRIVQGASMD
jgi:hypothetical protein